MSWFLLAWLKPGATKARPKPGTTKAWRKPGAPEIRRKSDRLDARHFSQHRQLELILQITEVVNGSIEVLAAECRAAAEAYADHQTDEHHAPRHGLRGRRRQRCAVQHSELFAAPIAFHVFGDGRRVEL